MKNETIKNGLKVLLVAVITDTYHNYGNWLSRNGEFGKTYFPVSRMQDLHGRRINEIKETNLAKENIEYWDLKKQCEIRLV